MAPSCSSISRFTQRAELPLYGLRRPFGPAPFLFCAMERRNSLNRGLAAAADMSSSTQSVADGRGLRSETDQSDA